MLQTGTEKLAQDIEVHHRLIGAALENPTAQGREVHLDIVEMQLGFLAQACDIGDFLVEIVWPQVQRIPRQWLPQALFHGAHELLNQRRALVMHLQHARAGHTVLDHVLDNIGVERELAGEKGGFTR